MTLDELVGVRRVAVIDDHRTFSELLTIGLESHPQLTCVGTAYDAASALALLEAERVDVVVMDFRIGQQSGIEISKAVLQRWPGTPIVLLTAYPTHPLMVAASAAGVSALLPKNGSLPELLHAVVSAQSGQFVVPHTLLNRLLDENNEHDQIPITAREMEVLQHLALGHEVRGISHELNISVHTCRGYVKSLLSKLDAHSQLEAVALAHQHGLLGPGYTV